MNIKTGNILDSVQPLSPESQLLGMNPIDSFFKRIWVNADDSKETGVGGQYKDQPKATWGPDFRPREAKNMPINEKITKWLQALPWFQIEEGYWMLECYPAIACSISSSGNLLGASDAQDVCEKQAWEITRIVTQNYVNNGEIPARPVTFGHCVENRSLEIEYTSEQDRSY